MLTSSIPLLSIVIPTYRRGAIVLDTVSSLISMRLENVEILIVDQTAAHPEEVVLELQRRHLQGEIRWLKLDRPSIPAAMNVGLNESRAKAVLFLDDDIVPDPGLVNAHIKAQATPGLVAGLVLQPGQAQQPLEAGESFRFNSTDPAMIQEFMGGNFSIDRRMALALAGFDENFVGAAYRFEAEFSHRYLGRFGLIRFEPLAIIHHLAVSSGGTRAHGHHLRTLKPGHSVGAYYFLLKTRRSGWLRQTLWRPLRSVRTRYHLRHPWWIPLTLVGEIRGFVLALRLLAGGPKMITSGEAPGQGAV